MAYSVFGPPPTVVQRNYVPHAGQQEINAELSANFRSPEAAAIVEVIASRGWGKTLWLVCSILVPYLETHPNAKVMWVAPTYLIAMSPIDDVFKGVDEETGEHYVPEFDPEGNRVWEFATTKSGPMLKWHNGATVVFRSADSPDSIVSKGFNFIIIDEAALIEERVFTQQILGTARKAGIKIFMITSPRGKKHWTHKIFVKGQDPNESQYLSFQQPYTKNPHFSPVLAKLIKDIPEWLYRQEYMAEFIEDGDSVFRGLEAVLFGNEINFESQQQEWAAEIKDSVILTPHGEVHRRASERRFVVSMDLAKSIDYTVMIGMDLETAEIIYYRRLNKTDYTIVLKEAADVCAKLNNADLIFDATGVGAGLADVLNTYDVISHPFVFTNDSKVEIVNKLAVAIEYNDIRVPNITTIKNELAVFTYALTRTGKISYGAPAGFHDDIVMAMAMANFYRKENVGSDEVGVIDAVIDFNNGKGNFREGSFADYMHNDND